MTEPPAASARRGALLDEVAADIASSCGPSVLRVGIDGRDGAGKTTFADELAVTLRERGVAVVRASVDRFHNPREVRYRRGRTSPEGYYLDSYDLPAIRRYLLDAAGPDGDRRVLMGIWDVDADRPIEPGWRTVPDGGVLLVDGIFLHRPELRDAWDVSLYLDVGVASSQARCGARDGGPSGVHDPRNQRYVQGQRLYHEACRPRELADRVIDNDVLDAPRIVGRPEAGAAGPRAGSG